MTESYAKEIKLPFPKLKSFIWEVQSKGGEILSLNELYARDQNLGNEIILGVVDTVFPVIKKRDRQLQILRLFEVTVECQKGQLFRVFAFNKFATSLADACLREGDFAAFCSACVQETSQYRIEKGYHHLEAHIGFPEQPSAKIFFARKPHITYAGTSRQQSSSTIYKSSGVSLKRHKTPHTASRGTAPSSTEISQNSTIFAPFTPILSKTARMSPFPPSILQCTSSSRDEQIQHALVDSAVALRSTQHKYTYKKISDLVEPEEKINMYGVIHTIEKMHAVVRLRDETCGPEEDFRVHIFFSHETAFRKLEQGYILRLHGLKTEVFDGVLVGCVFHAADVVTFPPDGQGIANAFATYKYFHFTDMDVERLTELRRWIASQKQQQPLPVVPVTSNTALVPPILSSEPIRSLLSEIKKEGNYILLCKVLDVNILSDEIRFFTVTDGTLLIYCIRLDEDERHATHEVRILVLDPSPVLKKIRAGSLVELINVTVQLHVAPASSLCNWPYLSLKINGNSCSANIFKGFESEAVKLKRQLQDAGLRDQQLTDSVEQLITGLISESPHQSDSDDIAQVADAEQVAEKISETYSEFADGIATGGNADTSTQSTGNQDTNTDHNMGFVRDEKVTEFPSFSQIFTSSVVDDLDALDLSSSLIQAHSGDTRMSNYHADESLVTAPAEVINSHDSVSSKVQRSPKDSKAVACSDEDEEMECHSAELHSSSTGCKWKFFSGIISGIQGIPADISHIKRTRPQDGEPQVYLLKAWVKDIEPPITRDSKMNIVSGFCDHCKSIQSYGALKIRQKNYLCQCCFQKGQESHVVLEYLLRLHLTDENDDELIVTVASNHGVELLGCTVNAYLYDSLANRRVVKILTDLIAERKDVPLQDRGPMLKFMVTPVHSSTDTKYIVHSTYLYTTHNSEG